MGLLICFGRGFGAKFQWWIVVGGDGSRAKDRGGLSVVGRGSWWRGGSGAEFGGGSMGVGCVVDGGSVGDGVVDDGSMGGDWRFWVDSPFESSSWLLITTILLFYLLVGQKIFLHHNQSSPLGPGTRLSFSGSNICNLEIGGFRGLIGASSSKV
ncbi:hypothetical protein CMV_021150, partial [Castanea mollissima]